MDPSASEQPSKLDTLIMGFETMRFSLEENTKATIAMSSAIRMIYLVPLALAAMGVSAWLLVQGKLTEWNFMTVALVCLTPFFGDGIGRVLDRLPLVGKKADFAQKASAGLFVLGVLIFFAF